MGAVSSSLHKGHRYPGEIISHCVWLYHRFPLSLREVEEMMLAVAGHTQGDRRAGSWRDDNHWR
jgi:hypothetical protein